MIEPVEPVVPTEPVVVPEPVDLGEKEVEEEDDSTVLFGLDMMTFVLICVGVVVFIALIITSVCTLRYKKNQQNRVASPATTPKRKSNSGKVGELRPVAETDVENNGTPSVFHPLENTEEKLNKNKGDF